MWSFLNYFFYARWFSSRLSDGHPEGGAQSVKNIFKKNIFKKNKNELSTFSMICEKNEICFFLSGYAPTYSIVWEKINLQFKC